MLRALVLAILVSGCGPNPLESASPDGGDCPVDNCCQGGARLCTATFNAMCCGKVVCQCADGTICGSGNGPCAP